MLLCVGIILFINLHPTFGGNPTKEQKERYQHFDNYVNGKFVNEVPTGMSMSPPDRLSMFKDGFAGNKDRNPEGEILVNPMASPVSFAGSKRYKFSIKLLCNSKKEDVIGN